MRRLILPIAGAGALVLGGCAGNYAGEGALAGAAVGAGVGAVTGGDVATGAAIGPASGAGLTISSTRMTVAMVTTGAAGSFTTAAAHAVITPVRLTENGFGAAQPEPGSLTRRL